MKLRRSTLSILAALVSISCAGTGAYVRIEPSRTPEEVLAGYTAVEGGSMPD